VRILLLWTVVALGWAPLARAQTPPVPAPSITIKEIVDAAGRASPLVAAAVARGEAADLAVGEAGRWPNPIVEYRSENWASGLPGGMPLDTFATITQTIELGGKRGARRGVFEAARAGASAAVGSTIAAAQREAAFRFLEAVRLRDRARALQDQNAAFTEMLRILRRRVEEGLTSESELARMTTEQSRSSADLLRANVASAKAAVPLSVLLEGRVVTPAALVRPALVPVPEGAASDLAAAVARRADVVSARVRVEAARQSLRFEEARGVPDLAVNGGLKRTAGANTGVIALSVPIPLFERNRAARIVAEGQVRAAELELDLVTRLAAAEAGAAVETARALQSAAMDLRIRLVEPAELARSAARSAFVQGAMDLLRLMDAERAHVEALVAANELEIDAIAAAVDARLALGESPLP
jgi:cobalt-zinc-cadmium efflux system outer membrane protein